MWYMLYERNQVVCLQCLFATGSAKFSGPIKGLRYEQGTSRDCDEAKMTPNRCGNPESDCQLLVGRRCYAECSYLSLILPSISDRISRSLELFFVLYAPYVQVTFESQA
ncbi:hypothetical protein PM082_008067 [Marasmius tenuissimus]|nr:hypothetical protein PM082_008067 [Marasmius tenuissimus]